tara:strand:- start:58972 stop:59430 length:459 start_codon:yes stop_codon:yes gene_type:complete
MTAGLPSDHDPDRGWQDSGVELAQMTIEQRVIIRVPMIRRPPPPPMPQNVAPDDGARRFAWVEHKGPKCIDIEDLRAAVITSSRGVDLMLRGHKRLRALLGRECRSANLYSGFYIQPHEDGRLCAGRDRVLARSGAECEITSLRRLVAEPEQ